MLLAKLLIGLGSAVAAVWILRSRWMEALSERTFRRLLWGALAAHGACALAIYGVVGRAVPSDASGYYLEPARAVLRGGIPQLDVASSYGVGFVYASAGLLWIWDDPRVFVAAALGFEWLTVWLWLRALGGVLPAVRLRRAALLYATSGHLLINVLIGQNQVWLAAALAGSVLLLSTRRALWSGALMATGALGIKMLGAALVPGIWPASGRRHAWLAGAAMAALLLAGLPAVLGADVLMPLRRELPLITSGNLPFLLTALGLSARGAVATAGLVVVAVTALVACARWWRLPGPAPLRAAAGSACLLLLVMLFSKKAYTTYLIVVLFPLCLLVAGTGGSMGWALAFAALGVCATIEPGLWFYWLDNRDLGALQEPALRGPALTLALVDLVLVGCYAAFAWLAWRQSLSPTAVEHE